MTVGERIKMRRKELDISADDLARILGISRSTIFRYENGDIEKLPIDVLKPIAEALYTTPYWLMGIEDESTSVTFYDIYTKLCKEHNISASGAAVEMGLSNSTAHKWKNGSVPDGKTLAIIADFFNVSTDYLQGRTNEKKPPANAEGFDDFTYALFNETKDLPEEKKQAILNMAKLFNEDLEKEGR